MYLSRPSTSRAALNDDQERTTAVPTYASLHASNHLKDCARRINRSHIQNSRHNILKTLSLRASSTSRNKEPDKKTTQKCTKFPNKNQALLSTTNAKIKHDTRILTDLPTRIDNLIGNALSVAQKIKRKCYLCKYSLYNNCSILKHRESKNAAVKIPTDLPHIDLIDDFDCEMLLRYGNGMMNNNQDDENDNCLQPEKFFIKENNLSGKNRVPSVHEKHVEGNVDVECMQDMHVELKYGNDSIELQNALKYFGLNSIEDCFDISDNEGAEYESDDTMKLSPCYPINEDAGYESDKTLVLSPVVPNDDVSLYVISDSESDVENNLSTCCNSKEPIKRHHESDDENPLRTQKKTANNQITRNILSFGPNSESSLTNSANSTENEDVKSIISAIGEMTYDNSDLQTDRNHEYQETNLGNVSSNRQLPSDVVISDSENDSETNQSLANSTINLLETVEHHVEKNIPSNIQDKVMQEVPRSVIKNVEKDFDCKEIGNSLVITDNDHCSVINTDNICSNSQNKEFYISNQFNNNQVKIMEAGVPCIITNNNNEDSENNSGNVYRNRQLLSDLDIKYNNDSLGNCVNRPNSPINSLETVKFQAVEINIPSNEVEIMKPSVPRIVITDNDKMDFKEIVNSSPIRNIDHYSEINTDICSKSQLLGDLYISDSESNLSTENSITSLSCAIKSTEAVTTDKIKTLNTSVPINNKQYLEINTYIYTKDKLLSELNKGLYVSHQVYNNQVKVNKTSVSRIITNNIVKDSKFNSGNIFCSNRQLLSDLEISDSDNDSLGNGVMRPNTEINSGNICSNRQILSDFDMSDSDSSRNGINRPNSPINSFESVKLEVVKIKNPSNDPNKIMEADVPCIVINNTDKDANCKEICNSLTVIRHNNHYSEINTGNSCSNSQLLRDLYISDSETNQSIENNIISLSSTIKSTETVNIGTEKAVEDYISLNDNDINLDNNRQLCKDRLLTERNKESYLSNQVNNNEVKETGVSHVSNVDKDSEINKSSNMCNNIQLLSDLDTSDSDSDSIGKSAIGPNSNIHSLETVKLETIKISIPTNDLIKITADGPCFAICNEDNNPNCKETGNSLVVIDNDHCPEISTDNINCSNSQLLRDLYISDSETNQSVENSIINLSRTIQSTETFSINNVVNKSNILLNVSERDLDNNVHMCRESIREKEQNKEYHNKKQNHDKQFENNVKEPSVANKVIMTDSSNNAENDVEIIEPYVPIVVISDSDSDLEINEVITASQELVKLRSKRSTQIESTVISDSDNDLDDEWMEYFRYLRY